LTWIGNNKHINRNYYFPYHWMNLDAIHAKIQCFFLVSIFTVPLLVCLFWRCAGDDGLNSRWVGIYTNFHKSRWKGINVFFLMVIFIEHLYFKNIVIVISIYFKKWKEISIRLFHGIYISALFLGKIAYNFSLSIIFGENSL
jgi:hypothetical protein